VTETVSKVLAEAVNGATPTVTAETGHRAYAMTGVRIDGNARQTKAPDIAGRNLACSVMIGYVTGYQRKSILSEQTNPIRPWNS